MRLNGWNSTGAWGGRRRFVLRAALAATAALTLIAKAGADVPHDVVDLGFPGDEVNSVGAVFGADAEGYLVVEPDHETVHRPTLPAGWDYFQLRGFTDPLASGGIGVAWGELTSAAGSEPVVWDPLTGVVEIPMPASAAAGHVVGVGTDGWVYVETSTTWNFSGEDHVEDVFAVSLDDLDARTTIPHVDTYESVHVMRFQYGKVWAQAFNAGDGWSGPRFVWDRASGTTADADPLINATPSGWVASTEESGGIVGGYSVGSTNMPADYNFFSNDAWTAPTVHLDNLLTNTSYDLTDDLAAAGAFAAVAYGVTDDGTVVGHMWMADETWRFVQPTHVFVWTITGGLTDVTADLLEPYLDDQPYGAFIQAYNESGKVAFQISSDVYVWQRSGGVASATKLDGVWSAWDADWSYQFQPVSPALAALPRRMNDLGQYVGILLPDFTCGMATPHGATQPGSNVQVQPDDTTTLTFGEITSPGETTVFTYDAGDPEAPVVPANFQLAGAGTLIDIATTATFAEGSSIHLAIHYDDTGMSAAVENLVRILHLVDGEWVDATDYLRSGGYLDTTNNVVYGVTQSLSPFAIVLPSDLTAPTISAPSSATLVTDCAGSAMTVTAAALGVTATDNSGTAPALTFSASSVSPGTSNVTCTATDGVGNSSQATIAVTVLRGPFQCAFQSPLDSSVDNRIKAGQTVPVKVRVTCDGTVETSATVSLYVVDQIDSNGTTVAHTVAEDDDLTDDSGNVFALSSDQYHYNLPTRGWSSASGARFRVKVRVQKPGHVDTFCEVVLKNK